MDPNDKIDFIGIGAGRSGTTWLAECLREHPDIMLPQRTSSVGGEPMITTLKEDKELDFFTLGVRVADEVPFTNHERGLDWYLGKFPPAEPGKVRGEISPVYQRDPHSAGLIKQAFPNVRIIAILRNPPDMIYSLYWLHKNTSLREHERTFEEAIDLGYYLEAALYYRNFKRYFDLFPAEQIHVIMFDDIKSDPAKVIRETYDFLEVRSDFSPAALTKKINDRKIRSTFLKKTLLGAVALAKRAGLGAIMKRIGSSAKVYRLYYRVNIGKGGYPPMSVQMRNKLNEYYQDDVMKLESLLGRDLSAWL